MRANQYQQTYVLKSAHGNVIGIFLLLSFLFFSLLSFAESAVNASTDVGVKQNLSTVFFSIGYPGKVSVHVGVIDANMKLPECPELQVFLPSGSRAWGKTSVGVRCDAPSVWTIYVQVSVNVMAEYLVAAVPLAQGQVVTSQDIIFENGDLTQLPAGVFTEPSQAVGRTVNISMKAGTVLRQELLKLSPVIQQGQTVKLISTGKGFSVSAEGQAMNKAIEGQLVQVKVTSGQIVTGVARQSGQVEVNF